MWIFQAPYNAIKRFQSRWFCELMGWIQNNVLWPALKAIGEKGKDMVVNAILEAASMEMENTEKFKWVFDKVRSEFDIETISNDLLNTIISLLYSSLKKQGVLPSG